MREYVELEWNWYWEAGEVAIRLFLWEKQPEYLGTFSTSRKCFIRVKNTMLTSLG